MFSNLIFIVLGWVFPSRGKCKVLSDVFFVFAMLCGISVTDGTVPL